MKIKNKILFLSALLTLSAVNAYAQREVGNGGDVVLLESGYCVLDLAEAGICKTANEAFTKQMDEFETLLKTSSVYISDLMPMLHDNFHEFDDLPFDLETKRGLRFLFSRLSYNDRATLRMALMSYHWSFTDMSLKNIGDEDTFLDLSKYQLEQAAIRSQTWIQIQSKLFNSLNLTNKVALIVHEVLYALVVPTEISNGLKVQLSRTARDLNGQWFESYTKPKGAWGFQPRPPAIGAQVDPVTQEMLFRFLNEINYPAYNVSEIGTLPRLYFPAAVQVYNNDDSSGKELKSTVPFWSFNNTREVNFPTIGEMGTWETQKTTAACTKLINKRKDHAYLALKQYYWETVFEKLPGSGIYALNFTEKTLHMTHAWQGRIDNSINSQEFKFVDVESCVRAHDEAYSKLREIALDYYEGSANWPRN